MKKVLTTLFVLCFSVIYAQSGLQKISVNLNSKLNNISAGEEALVWVFFNDKGNANEQLMKTASSLVSVKSLERRGKNIKNSVLVDVSDLPVNGNYINRLSAEGFRVKQVSKWLNGVSGYVKKSQVQKITSLPFVNSIDIVNVFPNQKPVVVKNKTSAPAKTQKPLGTDAFDYGMSYTQNQIMNVPAVHNLGITGKGVLVGIFDAGFTNLTHEVFSSLSIVAQYDFVNNRTYVGDGNGGRGSGTHGTETLSTLAGYKPGKLIGPAFNAKFVLAKTEDTESETPIEEDNWIRAIEWADSIGIDIATTSLGYIDYDAPYTSYTWQNMDGKTTRITKAADLAYQKGILVINSAGNEGFNATHNTLGAPSDGFNVIAVGAVTSTGQRASFSSVGNTVDGRIKPDIMAMGEGVTVANPYDNSGYFLSNGTSFSCPLAAGVAALVLSAKPGSSAANIREALRSTASKKSAPDREYGWGIIDALAAINSPALPVELASFTADISGSVATLKWSTATETNNLGFDIERGIVEGFDKTSNNWITVGFVKGSGTSAEMKEYQFTEKLVTPGKYCYRLKQKDYDGKVTYSQTIYVDNPAPNSIMLFQNYPNPFNPATTVNFSIPEKSTVRLSAFDVLGKEVSVIYSGEIEKGIYTFKFDGSSFASGTYFIRLYDGKTTQIKKMLLMK